MGGPFDSEDEKKNFTVYKCFQRLCAAGHHRASPTEEDRVIHRECQLGKAV